MRLFTVIAVLLALWPVAAMAGEEPAGPVIYAFLARDGEGGKPVRRNIEWTLTRLSDQTRILNGVDWGTPEVELFPGEYRMEVVRTTDGARVVKEFTLGTVNKTVMMPFPKLAAE